MCFEDLSSSSADISAQQDRHMTKVFSLYNHTIGLLSQTTKYNFKKNLQSTQEPEQVNRTDVNTDVFYQT